MTWARTAELLCSATHTTCTPAQADEGESEYQGVGSAEAARCYRVRGRQLPLVQHSICLHCSDGDAGGGACAKGNVSGWIRAAWRMMLQTT